MIGLKILTKTMDNSETLIKAAGRICLFGDHQDYLGLPIIACAINRFISLSAKPNNAEMFVLDMPDTNAYRSFSIHEDFKTIQKGDHIASVIRVVKRYGCIPNIGYDVCIKGTIPINAGLSSSSALVVAWVRFLLETFGCSQSINDELIAEIAYEAEVTEQQSPGGRMDQYTIALGGIIFLETGDKTSYKKIKTKLKGLIIGESGIPKNTVGVLSTLKDKAIRSIEIIKEKVDGYQIEAAKLSDVDTYSYLLPEELIPYFYAAVKNYSITKKAYKMMGNEMIDYEQMGQLMNQHHQVLKEVLKITTPKIDAMIDAALEAGAYGAKIVGSGGGGSICAIAPIEKQQPVIDQIIKAGGKDAYKVSVASAGKGDIFQKKVSPSK